jgi:dTMP kinase
MKEREEVSVSKGKLLILEGGVGCGTTTQAKLLQEALPDSWRFFREPGGTPYGEELRPVLQSKEKKYRVHPYASLFGYASSRANLVRGTVIPILREGGSVCLERYWYSTWAYQGAEGVSKLLIWAINLVATKGLKHDLVLHYDLVPELGKLRKENCDDQDRYDLLSPDFHQKVRRNYRQLQMFYPRTWKVIDASKPIEEVFEESMKYIRKFKLI